MPQSKRSKPSRTSAPATAAPPPAGTAQTPRRRLERVGERPAAPRTSGSTRASRRAEFADLDPEDASIPLDRLPYISGDLRRVALMALIIIVLIVVSGYLLAQHNL